MQINRNEKELVKMPFFVPALGEVRMTLFVRIALISLFAVGMGGCGQAEQVAEEKDAVQQEAPSAVAVHDADTFVEPSENQEGKQVTEGVSADESGSVVQKNEEPSNLVTESMFGYVEEYAVKGSSALVTESEWKGVKCVTYNGEYDGFLAVLKCTFPNATLQQAYDVLKNKDDSDLKRLKPELPANNIKYGDYEKPPIVTYTYRTPKHLLVEFDWPGGLSTLEILEKENETQAIFTMSD
jgi:hypothetical protein